VSAQIHIRNETNELRLLFEVCQVLEATGDLGMQMESILQCMASHTTMLWGGIALSVRGDIAARERFRFRAGKIRFLAVQTAAGV
jgi:hypothetical protein